MRDTVNEPVFGVLTAIGIALYAGAGLAPATAEEIRSTLSDQSAIAVTIYNENLALVRDQRQLNLPTGGHSIAVRDVSARIRPETALLTSAADGLVLLEQNFDYDLLSPQTLLNKYIGQSVTAITINPANGNETREQATVLATNDGVVLKFADRIETRFPGRLVFEQVPQNLRDRPTLVLEVDNARAGERQVELSYLTSGLGWKADYVASLSDGEDRLNLNGWVTLSNESGTTYRNALLQLVAGDVQQVEEAMPRMRSAMVAESFAAAAPMQQESLFDYHLYTLPRPTTIKNQQTKQVALMQAGDVPVKKTYQLRSDGRMFGGRDSGEVKQKIGVFLSFVNDQVSNLGVPLPAGIVRVYKNDTAGRTQFIGEDRVDHTPEREKIKLKLGDAFDVTASRVQTGFRKVANIGQYSFSAEISIRIKLANAKEQPVVVQVLEVIPGDWQIRTQSLLHKKLAANLVEWSVHVPAQGEAIFEYSALVRY